MAPRRTRKRTYRRKAPSRSVAALSKKVARIDKRTKVEYKKLYNRNTTVVDCDYTGFLHNLSEIPSSISDNGKIGDEVRAVNLQLRYSLFTGTEISRVRVIVFRDYLNQVTLPNEWLVYAGTAQCPISPRVDKNLPWGVTLYDKVHNLSDYGTPIVGGGRNIKIDKTIQFGDGVSTVTANAIKLLVIADVADGLSAASKPKFLYSSVLSYTDN